MKESIEYSLSFISFRAIREADNHGAREYGKLGVNKAGTQPPTPTEIRRYESGEMSFVHRNICKQLAGWLLGTLFMKCVS